MRNGARTSLLCILLSVGALNAQGLHLRISDGQVRVSAPQMHFLNGQPMERLQNGAPVAFALQLTLSRDRERTNMVQRDIRRFIVSYDIWAEKYSVTKLGQPRRRASQLTAAAAENWCIADMAVPATGIAGDRPVWAKLEVRTEDVTPRDDDSDNPMSLTRLIDIFSRRARDEKTRWTAEAGPLRLAELAGSPK